MKQLVHRPAQTIPCLRDPRFLYDSDAVDSYLTSGYTTEDDQALGIQSSDDADCEREEENDHVDTSSIPLFEPE